jgi:hypothetical protein
MRRSFVFLILFIFCVGLLFSADEIVVGKRYTKDELASFINLELYARITISSRILLVYKTKGEGLSDRIYNIKRLVILEDDKGNFLDGCGFIILPNIRFCTLVTNNLLLCRFSFLRR